MTEIYIVVFEEEKGCCEVIEAYATLESAEVRIAELCSQKKELCYIQKTTIIK